MQHIYIHFFFSAVSVSDRSSLGWLQVLLIAMEPHEMSTLLAYFCWPGCWPQVPSNPPSPLMWLT